MAWETVEDNGGGDFEERERLSTKIGSRVEGTFRRVGDLRDGKYGPVRWVDVDTLDGVEGNFPLRSQQHLKVLENALEDELLTPGVQVRFLFDAKETGGGNTMNKLTIQVNRGGGGKATPKKTATKAKAPEPADDDEPDF
jgi:hypothetical protein